MDIPSYFGSASKSSEVSRSSYSEDGYAQPNPPKKHCSRSTSKPPSKSGSGIRRSKKSGWEETFPWIVFDENYRVHSENAKRVEDLFRALMGLGLPNHSLTGRWRLRK